MNYTLNTVPIFSGCYISKELSDFFQNHTLDNIECKKKEKKKKQGKHSI